MSIGHKNPTCMLQASKTEIRYESSIGKEELTLKDKMANKKSRILSISKLEEN